LLLLLGCYSPELDGAVDAKPLDALGADGLEAADSRAVDGFFGDGAFAQCDVPLVPFSSTFSGSFPAEAMTYGGAGVTVSVVSGALQVLIPSGSPSVYGGLQSIDPFDLVGAAVVAHLVDVPSPPANAYLGVQDGSGAWIGLELTGTTLAHGFQSSFATTAWNPSESWWRVRERAGRVYLDVSSTGAHWREVDSVESPPWVIAAYFDLGGGTAAVHPTGDAVALDDLNNPPPCP
jgi:hypothetical protein